MEFIDSNQTGQAQYAGFDIELAKYIAAELGVELKIEAMEFSACQGAVQSKTVDISISGYSKTAEREENFNMSDFYYPGDNETEQCVLILKSRASELSTAESFAGKTVSAQNASLQWNLLTEQLPDAVANPITDLNVAVLEVINGKVDALCVAIGNGRAFIENYPELALSEYQFTVEDEGNVVLLPKGADALTVKVNEILQKAYDAGFYKTWYEDAKALASSLGVE